MIGGDFGRSDMIGGDIETSDMIGGDLVKALRKVI